MSRPSSPASTFAVSGASGLSDDAGGSVRSLGGARRFGARRDYAWFIIALSVAIASPALTVGKLADDHIQALLLTHSRALAGYSQPWWRLFDFARPDVNRQLMADGVLPWWTDPELKISFFRPLSALTHWLDYRLWPDSTRQMHAQNLAWLALLLFCSARLYEGVLGRGVAAFFALLMYALDNTRILPITWIASRNTLIACAFSILSIHWFLRPPTGRFARWASPLALAVALLGAEGALATLAYLAAAALFPSNPEGQSAAPLARVVRLWPHALVLAIYLTTSQLLRYGVAFSGEYLNPLHEPLSYLRALPGRLLALLGAEFAAVGAEFWTAYDLFLPGLSQVVACYIALACLGLFWLVRPLLARSASARFFLCGALLSLPLAAATSPHGRTLSWAAIGAMGLFAEYITSLDLRRPNLQRLAIAGIVFVHVFISPLTIPGGCRALRLVQDRWEASDRAIQRHSDADARLHTVVYVNPPQDPMVMFTPAIRAGRGEPPLAQRRLYAGFSELRLERRDSRSLELSAKDGFSREPTERLPRGDEHRLKLGERISLPGMQAQVLELTSDHRPKRVRFEFDRALDDPGFLWLVWRDGDFQRFELPAAGRAQTIPATDAASALLGVEHPFTKWLTKRHAAPGRTPCRKLSHPDALPES